MKQCRNCGTAIANTAECCIHCGAAVDESSYSPTEPDPIPQSRIPKGDIVVWCCVVFACGFFGYHLGGLYGLIGGTFLGLILPRIAFSDW